MLLELIQTFGFILTKSGGSGLIWTIEKVGLFWNLELNGPCHKGTPFILTSSQSCMKGKMSAELMWGLLHQKILLGSSNKTFWRKLIKGYLAGSVGITCDSWSWGWGHRDCLINKYKLKERKKASVKGRSSWRSYTKHQEYSKRKKLSTNILRLWPLLNWFYHLVLITFRNPRCLSDVMC